MGVIYFGDQQITGIGARGPQGDQGDKGDTGDTGADSEVPGPIGATAGSLRLVVDGQGNVIPAGLLKPNLVVPYNCTITSWVVLADVAGTITFDIWKDTYANFPPVVGDSLPSVGDKPSISSSGVKATGSSFSGWTDLTLDVGDILRFYVDACTVITQATLDLLVTRT